MYMITWLANLGRMWVFFIYSEGRDSEYPYLTNSARLSMMVFPVYFSNTRALAWVHRSINRGSRRRRKAAGISAC